MTDFLLLCHYYSHIVVYVILAALLSLFCHYNIKKYRTDQHQDREEAQGGTILQKAVTMQ